MKKPKSLEVKLRSAIRLIWSRSAERRAIIKAATLKGGLYPGQTPYDYFKCPECHGDHYIQMAEVDHIEPIGALESWKDTSEFINKMFFSPQRAICKLCHKRKTKEDMRKMRAKRKIS